MGAREGAIMAGLDYQYYKYLKNDGSERTVKVNSYMASLTALDLDAADLTKAVIPRKNCRAVYVQDAAGRTRELVVGSPAAFAALTGASTFSLRDPGSATLVTFNLVGRREEKPERTAHAIANQ